MTPNDILDRLRFQQKVLHQKVLDLQAQSRKTERIVQDLDEALGSLEDTEQNRLLRIYASDLLSFAHGTEQRGEILAHHLVPIREYLDELERLLEGDKT